MRLCGFATYESDWGTYMPSWMMIPGEHTFPESDTAFFGSI